MSKQIAADCAAKIAAAFAGGNLEVSSTELVKLTETLLSTFSDFLNDDHDAPQPAVPIEESVHDDYIICLEDGHQVTLLKRYLENHHGMTVEEYIDKWSLPEGYPFVAKSYSEKRRAIAKKQGLGKSPQTAS